MTSDGRAIHSRRSSLHITGLGSQYPLSLLGPEKLRQFAEGFCDVESPGVKKLLQINARTGIKTRAAIEPYGTSFGIEIQSPTIKDIDAYFRQAGVGLAVEACRKAMCEAKISAEDITHTVAVTCTSTGIPGYDLLVDQSLGLSPAVDRTLLHGVGCAGGLAIMRAAAQLADGASFRGRPACILAFACELSSPNFRHELEEAQRCTDLTSLGIAAALFSDAAAAFVLCNDLAMESRPKTRPIFDLVEWGHATIPKTVQHVGFYPEPEGYHTVLTQAVTRYTKEAISPMFEQLRPLYEQLVLGTGEELCATDFDWALHPGGLAIIEGAEEVMKLSGNQLRASREIYETRGNSASPTVLVVLDRLRSDRNIRDHVVATSFGPGIAIEMAMLKTCHHDS